MSVTPYFEIQMVIKKYTSMTLSREPDSDIVLSEFSPNLKVDLVLAKEMVANRLDFTENKTHYLIIDYSNTQQITTEAKAYMQNPETGLKNILGAALVASNPVSVLMANVFLKTRTTFPQKFFTDRADAYNWLRSIIQGQGTNEINSEN
jgi:hypothetical protein